MFATSRLGKHPYRSNIGGRIVGINHAQNGGIWGPARRGHLGDLPVPTSEELPAKSKLKGTHGGRHYTLPKAAGGWEKGDLESPYGRGSFVGVPYFHLYSFWKNRRPHGLPKERERKDRHASNRMWPAISTDPYRCGGPNQHRPMRRQCVRGGRPALKSQHVRHLSHLRQRLATLDK